MTVEVFVPGALAGGDLGQVRPFETAEELASLLSSGSGPAVVWSDGLPCDAPDLAAAIRGRGAAVIEVRAERWDGFSASPLSAACRGVISGFGTNGMRVAVALLEAGK